MQKCMKNLQVIDYQANYFYSMMNGKQLREYRAQKRMSQAELSKISGLSQATISRIEATDDEIDKNSINSILNKIFNSEENIQQNEEYSSHRISEPKSDYIYARTKTPPSNAIQIGEMVDEESSPFIDIGGGQYIMVVPLVPIKAQAGYIQHYNDEKFISDNFTQKHSFAVSRVYKGKYMAFIVDGDSMDNGVAGEAILEGYTVTGREIQKQHWRNKFHIHRYKDYVIVHQEGIFIKQISKHDTENGVITCHSLNPNKELYADFELSLDDCYQIFNVVNVTQTK